MVRFESNGIQINLNFSDPLLISQGQKADQVVIRLLKSYFLRSDPVLVELNNRKLATLEEDEEYLVIRADVPRQMMSEEDRVAIENAAETLETVFASSVVLSFILNLFLSGVMSQLWNIFNTLQIILSLPLLAILIPANVALVCKVIDQIVNISLVDKQWLQDKVVVPIYGLRLSEAQLGQDLENASLLLNVFEIIAGVTLLMLLIGLCVCCKRSFPRCCPCFKKLITLA